ncbi:MAG: hypothetical protein OXC25_10435 [Thiotrichales bacterium]|nr:hypothetical protein [Thiotrichales bacterium]
MNKLPKSTKEAILLRLSEGMSMRATAQVVKCSYNSVARLMYDAGRACATYHDTHVRGIQGKRFIECDYIWSFIYAKEKNVPTAIAAPEEAGHVWTWTAIDSDSKLILAYLVSDKRGVEPATIFMADLASRLEDDPELYTNGLQAYVPAVRTAFGAHVNYGQLVKGYGTRLPRSQQADPDKKHGSDRIKGFVRKRISGNPDMERLGTSYVERSNLTMRMCMRRYTRFTNAFSKKIEAHVAMVHFYMTVFNWVRSHMTLSKGRNKVTPAMAAGLATEPMAMGELVDIIEAAKPPPKKPGPKIGTVYRPRMARARRIAGN